MDPKPVVHDISSDEEGWGDTRGGGGDGDGVDDLDWISELLDDDDDVVLVGEVLANPRQRSTSVVATSSVKDLDDDDCVVLDGDPDKPVAIENDKEGESDDLLIVGEKGQIACRDYPHPRHLCAKFPFSSTPHEKHCDLCHCYVCDSHAPCVYWSTETSSINHCHATDKEEFWKVQRRSLKNGDRDPLPVSKLCDTYQSVRLPQMNHASPPTLPLLAQNQVSTSTTIRACSMSTDFSIPSIINQGRSQRSGYVLPRGKFQPHLVSRQLHGTHNNLFRKDRRHNVGSLGSQFVSSNTMVKRRGNVGVSITNNSGYSSSYNNYGSQYSRNPLPVATSNGKDPTKWQDIYSGVTSGSKTYWCPSQQNASSILANPLPSRPQVSSQPNMDSIFVNSVPPQPIVSSQPNMDNVFVNPLPRQPDVSSQPSMDSIFADSVPSQPQVSPQPTVDSIFANSAHLSQPQVYSQPIPDSNDNLDGFQQGNQTQSALESSFQDFDPSWVTPTSYINQQPPVENSHLQSSEATYNLPLATEFDPIFPVSPIPDSLDFQLESWILGNQSVSGVLEVSAHPGLNLLSPEPSHAIDTGNLFDF